MSIGTGLVRRADQKKNEFWAFKTWDPEWCVYGQSPSSPLQITSIVGNRTLSIDGKKTRKFHQGLDISMPVGTYIRAPQYCKCVRISRTPDAPSGNYVSIVIPAWWFGDSGPFGQFHTNNLFNNALYRNDWAERAIASYAYATVRFMHLSSIANINEGEWLEPGQIIGRSGNTGRSTGPHLHLDCAAFGDWLNPAQMMSKCYFSISKKEYAPAINPYDRRRFTTDVGSKPVPNYQWIGDFQRYNKIDVPFDPKDTEPIVPEVKLENLQASQRLAPGIWQIVKLIIDENVANRQVFDGTITNQTGSLLNWFNKVCQEPFVEFMGETFGDQYYFIARRPPFDHLSVLRAYNYAIGGSGLYHVVSKEQVVETSFTQSVSNAYSWYYLRPRVSFGGNSNTTYYIPAVFFPEMAALFGSRACHVQSNYYNTVNDGEADIDNANEKISKGARSNFSQSYLQMMLDLKFLIETTIYLPFTRQGTITLYGYRQIKRGMWIHFAPTDEMYYVDAVTNTFQSVGNRVFRSTTLQVSRGMKVSLIDKRRRLIAGSTSLTDRGVEGFDWERASYHGYFGIVDFGDISEGHDYPDKWDGLIDGSTTFNECISDIKINQMVLNELCKKVGFLPNDTNNGNKGI